LLQYLHAAESAAALQQLSSLTELSISHVGDDWAGHVLAALTGLSSLMIVQPSSVTDVGVLQLKTLKHLSSLWVASEGLSRELCMSGTRGILQLVSAALQPALIVPGDVNARSMGLLHTGKSEPPGHGPTLLAPA
jgi:hypothetical protein